MINGTFVLFGNKQRTLQLTFHSFTLRPEKIGQGLIPSYIGQAGVKNKNKYDSQIQNVNINNSLFLWL